MESGNFEGGRGAHCKLWELPSMCGGDAAFCQITLITCYYYYNYQTDGYTETDEFAVT